MNADVMEGKWRQVKGKVREKWGKLTDGDLDVIDGRREQLVGKLRERYGLAREQAQKQVDEFWKQLETFVSKTTSERKTEPEHEYARMRKTG